MRISTKSGLLLLLMLGGEASLASDACSSRAILTSADVTVSDGSSFSTRSFFHSPEVSAIQHIEDEQIVAVEGPHGWIGSGERTELGGDFHKLFALGHQYHAFLLHFEELVTNPRRLEQVAFGDGLHPALSGDYPYGGTVYLVEVDGDERPAGLVFEFPERSPMPIRFSDWRSTDDGTELPFVVEIQDDERVFTYRYSSIEIAPRSPLWFFEDIVAPDIDEVRIHRLHRKMLAAHCLGDAEMIAELSADSVVSANAGRLTETSNDVLRERFSALFERIDYSEYHDIAEPVIEVSESADVAWIAVNVRAVGSEKLTGSPFDSQWAWIMTVRKTEGLWLHAGNASNLAE